jgi:hypothetical protein
MTATCQEKVPDGGGRGRPDRICGQPARWAVVTRERDGSLAFYTPRCDAHLEAAKRRHERLGLKYLVAQID